jgi:hypothetical protein
MDYVVAEQQRNRQQPPPSRPGRIRYSARIFTLEGSAALHDDEKENTTGFLLVQPAIY